MYVPYRLIIDLKQMFFIAFKKIEEYKLMEDLQSAKLKPPNRTHMYIF